MHNKVTHIMDHLFKKRESRSAFKPRFKPTRRKLLTTLGSLILFGSVVFLVFRWVSNPVEAAWFNDQWLYRKLVTVTIGNTSPDATYVDTLLTIDTDDFITAGKLQSACQDLRFTSVEGTELPYYIDSACNGNSTRIWVKMDKVPASTTTYTMYMYYGNATAVAGTAPSEFTNVVGLRSYWPMNESGWNGTSGEAKNISVLGTNATAVGNATTTSSGQYANAGTFDGTGDYLTAGTTPILTETSSFTMASWVYMANTAAGNIFTQSNATDADQLWQFAVDDFANVGAYIQMRDMSGGNLVNVNSNTTLALDTWYHVAVTADSTTDVIKFYINGVLTNTASGNITGTFTTNLVSIGTNRQAGSPSGSMFGRIDDLRLYNRVMSDGEIEKLYENPGGVTMVQGPTSLPSLALGSEENSPGPAYSWGFNEGYGTTVNDGGPNNKDGTIQGSTTWQNEDQCVSGKCLYFDGTGDYISTPSFVGPQTGSTFEAWLKLTTVSGTKVLMSQYQGSAYMQFILLDDDIQFRIHQTQDVNYIQTTANNKLVANKWQHIVGTWDGGTTPASLKIYVDGRRVDDTTVTAGTFTAPYASAVVFNINGQGNGSALLTGFMDEVKIYNYARSAAQVKTNYNAGKTGQSAAKGIANSLSGNRDQVNQWISDYLYGYWKFDDAATPSVDASGNGNSGTWNGNVASTATSKFSKALTFDGTGDYVDWGDVEMYDTTVGATWSLWFRPTTLGGARRALINKWQENGGSERGMWLGINTSNQIAGRSNSASFFCNGTTTLSTNTWYHATMTVDVIQNKLTVYLNGKEECTQTGSIVLTDFATNTFRVGRTSQSDGGNDDFAGQIDDVRVYKGRILSPVDITNVYNWAPGPSSYWKMDENTSTSAFDSSTNGRTGTLTGGWSAGKFGSAVNLDGTDDMVSIADDPIIDMDTSSFTLSAWIKNNGNDDDFIFYKRSGGNLGYNMYIGASGRVRFQIADGTTTISNTPGTKDVGDNAWHYVTMVADRANGIGKIYVDGVQEGSNIDISTVTGSLSNAVALQLGLEDNSNTDFLGLIDDAKIYKYARSQKQIIEDMNGGHPAGGSPVSSMLGYWNFDEQQGQTINDKGFGANNGTRGANSTPTTDDPAWKIAGSSTCKVNGCLDFDGTDDLLDMGDVADYDTTFNAYTVSAWVNPDSGNGTYRYIMGKMGNAGQRGWQMYMDSAYKITFGYFDGISGSAQEVTTPNAISAQTWTHVTAVFSASNFVKIYINGRLVANQTTGVLTTLNGANTATLQIGNRGNSLVDEYFSGLIDEVKIYNTDLTTQEVLIDYNAGSATALGGVLGTQDNEGFGGNPPLLWWKLDDNTGTAPVDSSGNGNTGAFTNTPTWVAGKNGPGLHFTNAIVATSAPVSTATTNVTMEIWVRWDDATATANIYNNGSPGTNGYGLVVGDGAGGTGNKVSVRIGANYDVTSSTVTLLTNQWMHFALTRDSTTWKLYSNGVLNSTGTTSPTTPGTSTRIGSAPLNGVLDDVRFYDYEKTAAQIAYDYNRGAPLLHYKFDECQGLSAYNTAPTATGSGTINTGTITIGASGTYTSAGTCGSASSSQAWAHGSDSGLGKRDYALGFDGTDDTIDLGLNTFGPLLHGAAATTIAAWVKVTSFPADNSRERIINSYIEGGDTGTSFNLFDDSGLIEIAGRSQAADSFQTARIALPALSTWTHVVGVFDYTNDRIHIYINGNLVQTTPVTFGSSTYVRGTANQNDRLGSTASSEYFNGLLDDVRIYRYGLSANQIKQVYNNGAIFFGPASGTP